VVCPAVPKEYVQSATHLTAPERARSPDSPDANDDEDFEGVDNFTNHMQLAKSFDECHIEHDYLDYEDFKLFMEKNAYILDYVESMFPYSGVKSRVRGKSDALPHVKRLVCPAL
jgi:hypothetical protein